MNLALSLIAASIVISPQTPTPTTTGTAAAANVLERIYKVGDEATYQVLMGDSAGPMHLSAKVHVKTLVLLDGGKASQELSASDFTGGPEGASGPEKVSWTFGKDGMAAADFTVNSGTVVYSILSMLSFVPGAITSGKEFKVEWASPDKMSTITGTGTYEGTKELKGAKVAVIKTTLEVTPGSQGKAVVHNTSSFDPATGKLVAAEGTVEVGSMTITISVTSG